MPERSKNPPTPKRARRRRDPAGTREAILAAAREVLAKGGKEGLSVAQVAQYAGVNRGTAYQHFRTRDQLIEATAAWVSDKIFRAVFGDPAVASSQPVESIDPKQITERVVDFAMENPELGRVWLFELLNSRRPASDPFWRQYETNYEQYAKTDLAQPGIDVEVAAVLTLAGSFLWPVWARAHARNAKERKALAVRFTREIMRLSLHGTMRPEKYHELDQQIAGGTGSRRTR